MTSDYKKISIEDATNKQLHTVCVEILGLQVRENAPRDELVAAILALDPSRIISVPDDPQERAGLVEPQDIASYMQTLTDLAGSSALKGKGASFRTDPIFEILIPKQDVPGGADDVPVGVNGPAMQIPRGRVCQVPLRYVLVLMNAKRDVIEHDMSDPGNVKEVRKVVQAYPFEVKKGPPPEAIKAWFEGPINREQLAAA